MTIEYKTIAFQGTPGAYSDLACRNVFSDLPTLPCHSFEDTFEAVRQSDADLAMIPIDNTLAGRVADVHHLMTSDDIFIVGEHFQAIHHHLMGIKDSSLDVLKHVHSHTHAIPQCKKVIKELGLQAHIHSNTAAAAQDIANRNDPAHGAIASKLAAEIYGLKILKENIHDEHHNTTRFLFIAREPDIPDVDTKQNETITSLLFSVRNIPASLYKALGGFATNGFSLAKLESYVDEHLQVAQFYCEIEGHPENDLFKLALEELGFYAKEVRFLGSYLAHPFRQDAKKKLSAGQS